MECNREEVIVSALSSLLLERAAAGDDFSALEEFGISKTHELLCQAIACALKALDQAIFEKREIAAISKGFERREILTGAGTVSFSRRRYATESGSVYLTDEVLNLPAHTKVTPLLTSTLTGLALDSSYRAAARALRPYLGADISAPAVGRALKESAKLLAREVDNREERCCALVLDVEADGTYVAMQRSRVQKKDRRTYPRRKEVSVMSAYEGKVCGKNGKRRRVNPLHYASSKGADVAWGEFSRAMARKWDVKCLHHINLATDGDVKYKRGKHLMPACVSSGYDLYHITSALRPVFGAEIAGEIYAVMRDVGFDTGAQMLSDYAQFFFERTGDKKYLKTRDFIKRNEREIKVALARNLGTMEGSVSHIVASRLKRFGGGWGTGLEAMVRLRAAHASGEKIALRVRNSEGKLADRIEVRLRSEVQNMTLFEIEGAIAALERKAKGMSRQNERTSNERPYYRQAHVAHNGDRASNPNYLHLWS